MPSALAVFMFTTNTNFVGCSIGKSPGFAPLKILSTYVAARPNRSRGFPRQDRLLGEVEIRIQPLGGGLTGSVVGVAGKKPVRW